MSKIAVSIKVAAFILFDQGFEFNQVNDILNNVKKPCEGFVYVGDLPIQGPTKVRSIRNI